MIHCHVYPSNWHAFVKFDSFCDSHNCEVINKRANHEVLIATLRNGEEHYFISETTYNSWCKGRTYMLGQELFCSGYPLKGQRGEKNEKLV